MKIENDKWNESATTLSREQIIEMVQTLRNTGQSWDACAQSVNEAGGRSAWGYKFTGQSIYKYFANYSGKNKSPAKRGRPPRARTGEMITVDAAPAEKKLVAIVGSFEDVVAALQRLSA